MPSEALLGEGRREAPAVGTLKELEGAIDRSGFSLIEVRTVRSDNVIAHRDLHARAARALAEEGPWR